MNNLLLTLTLRLDKISLAFREKYHFSGYFSVSDTDSCFELLTLLCQKLIFSKFLFIAPIILSAILCVCNRDLHLYHNH